MDHGTMEQHRQKLPRTSTALGGGTIPGNGSGRQTEQQNQVKCRVGCSGSKAGRRIPEEGGKRGDLCQAAALPAGAALGCSPAQGWGTPGTPGAAAAEQSQGQALVQQHRAAPAHSLPIPMLGLCSQGEFPIQGLSVLTIPAGKTTGMKEGDEEPRALHRKVLEVSYEQGRMGINI